MTASFNGALGVSLERVGLIGSRDGIVQDPEERRDLVLYGDYVIFDGSPVELITAVAEGVTDIPLTTSWVRVPGCVGVSPESLESGRIVAVADVWLKNTSGGAGQVEFGLSASDVTEPTAAFNSFSNVPASADGPSPVSGPFAESVAASDTLYLWARGASGTGLSISGSSRASRLALGKTLAGSDGNVTGPASAVDGELASYDGTTGKIIKGGSASFGGTVETRGNALNISTAGDVLHGTLLDTPEGVALAYTPGSVYDPDDGGVEPVSGGVVLHGAAIAVDQWAATDGTTYNVTQTNGVLSFEPQPPPGWVDETTGVGEAALDFLGVWVPVTVTQNATQIQVTVQEDVAVGAPMAVSSVVYITNSSSDRGGTVTIGYSVNGGAPIAIGAPHYIPGGFSGMVLPPAVEAAAGYTAGDTVELWARRETEEHGQFAPAIDGTIGTHDLRISVASSGASAPSAPTEREITQSGATTITIADNETVVLTTDNTLATIEVAAPAAGKATIGTLIVIDGGSGNNLSFPGVAADWANGGNIPDTTADRHTIGLQRGASGTYTLTHGAHQ